MQQCALIQDEAYTKDSSPHRKSVASDTALMT